MAKTYLELNHITVSYGPREVLNIEHFALSEGEKIGLVGENGAGKSTLLRIIAGDILPQTGTVNRYAEVAFLHQMDERDERQAVDGHLMRLFGVQAEADTLSGGERTRRRIAASLGSGAQLLLADEPTSDLDADGVRQLERALIDFEGSIILVSHDRSLLNNVCTCICHLEDGHLTRFPGSYDAYREERERRRNFAAQEYEAYRAEQNRLRASIQRRNEQTTRVLKTPKRMGNSEARLHKRESTEVQQKLSQQKNAMASRLSKLEVKERPRDDPSLRMRLGDPGQLVSKTALEISGCTLSVPGKTLLQKADMRLPTGTRTALLGPNGCGKTTLVHHILAGGAGVRLAPGVKIGLFGQDHLETLDADKTLLENALRDAIQPEDVVRTVLARLGLRGDQVFKHTAILSGGERAKLALARILVGEANVLVLDEPTNHLDIYALEALESMLEGYAGTVLLVTHDRALVSKVATRLVFFEEGRLRTFEGTMAAYEESKAQPAHGQAEAVDLMMLDMRLAELSGRIAHPRKRDKVVELRAEYEELALKRQSLTKKS